jgi:hypothetical protein
MEQLLTQSTVDYLTDLKDIIKYFTNDTNRQFAEIMNHVDTTFHCGLPSFCIRPFIRRNIRVTRNLRAGMLLN